MSLHRENTIWQSEDGTWSIGFNDYYVTGPDHEWDVEYADRFYWAATDLPSEEAAWDAWDGANPGSSYVIPYSKKDAHHIERLNDEVAILSQNVRDGKTSNYNQYPTYKGSPKPRKLAMIAQELYRLKTQAMEYRMGGYSNLPSDRIPQLENTLKTFDYSKASPETMKRINGYRLAYIEKIKGSIEAKEKAARNAGRWGPRISYEQRARYDEILEDLKKDEKAYRRPRTVKAESTKNTAQSPAASKASNKALYHINPATGRANKCNAKVRDCPYGGASDHYSTKEAARAAYEKSMNKKTFTGLRK